MNLNLPRLSRHAALLTRVSVLVKHSESALLAFRSVISQFRAGQNGPQDVIDTIYAILNRDVNNTVAIITSVESLLTGVDIEKRNSLKETLKRWASNERSTSDKNYPVQALGAQANYSGIATGRVINVKRTAAARTGSASAVWDRVERAASSAGPSRSSATGSSARAHTTVEAYPSLGAGSAAARASGKQKAPAGRPVPGSTAWASASAAAPRASPLPPPIPFASDAVMQRKVVPTSVNYSTGASRSSGGPSKPPSQAAFPSLAPSSSVAQAAAQRKALFAQPSARAESIRKIAGERAAPAVAAWGSSSTPNSTPGSASSSGTSTPVGGASGSASAGEGGGGGGKKGKGKKKELLFTISARPT